MRRFLAGIFGQALAQHAAEVYRHQADT